MDRVKDKTRYDFSQVHNGDLFFVRQYKFDEMSLKFFGFVSVSFT